MRFHAPQVVLTLILALTLHPTLSTAAPSETAEEISPAAARLNAQLKACRVSYAEVEARIEKAGVRDAGYHVVDGFPYLRSDRLMASFTQELKDANTFSTWVLQLRDNEAFARDIELRNLGMSNQERAGLLSDLRLCSVWLSFNELQDEATLAQVFKGIPVPAAPVSAAVSTQKALQEREALIKADLAQPLQQLTSPGTLALWQPQALPADATEPLPFEKMPHDELGRSGMTTQQWNALAALHAPRWLIETAGASDHPGAPVWRSAPEQKTVSLGIDTHKPTVYYQASFARMGQRSLIQFTYFIFFAPSASDSAALDGMAWRVTLDPAGKPLIYDSVRMDGSDHLWFPAQTLAMRQPVVESGLLLSATDLQVFNNAWAIRLKSADHLARRLVTVSSDDPKAKSYALEPYENLLTLALPSGGTRSIYQADGVLAGATPQRAPRQLGALPATPTGKHYFDDPYLIETVYVAPTWPADPAQQIVVDDSQERAKIWESGNAALGLTHPLEQTP